MLNVGAPTGKLLALETAEGDGAMFTLISFIMRSGAMTAIWSCFGPIERSTRLVMRGSSQKAEEEVVDRKGFLFGSCCCCWVLLFPVSVPKSSLEKGFKEPKKSAVSEGLPRVLDPGTLNCSLALKLFELE